MMNGFRLFALCATVIAALGIEAAASPILITYFPQRPANSSQLLMASGVVTAYETTGQPLAEHLTIRQDRTGISQTFELSKDTRIDGRVLRCKDLPKDHQRLVAAFQNLRICLALPGVKIGTHVQLVYWPTRSSKVGAMASGIPGSGQWGTDRIDVIR